MVMAERLELAPGFRFCPTDQELITDYLKPMVLGDKLRYNFIQVIRLQSYPSYVVRRLVSKKAGCGTWVGRTKRKPIKEKGMLIGEQRMLVFEINDVGDQFEIGKAGHFRMHEYSLSGVNKGLKSASGGGISVHNLLC